MPLQYIEHGYLEHENAHKKGITCVSFNSTGSLLASGSLDGTMCVWDAQTNNLLYVWTGASAVLCCVWSSDSEVICGLESGYIATLNILPVRSYDPDSTFIFSLVTGGNHCEWILGT
jgi:WD40 repeat protein